MEENTVINEVIEEAATNTVENNAGGFTMNPIAAGFLGGLIAFGIVKGASMILEHGKRIHEERKANKENSKFFDITDKVNED